MRLRGDEPGAVVPSRAALLDRVHPHDRDRVARALVALGEGAVAYCEPHRLMTGDGRLREVVGVGGPAGDDPEARHGFVIALDGEPAAPLDGTPPGVLAPGEVSIPVPRGRDGTSDAEPVVPSEAAGTAAVPDVRPGEVADAEHAALMRRALDTLVDGLHVGRDAAATLVGWLANTHEVPPAAIADSLVALERDDAGRIDLAALVAVLDGGPRD